MQAFGGIKVKILDKEKFLQKALVKIILFMRIDRLNILYGMVP